LCWLRRVRWFSSRGVPALSAAIALAGALWFAARLPVERPPPAANVAAR